MHTSTFRHKFQVGDYVVCPGSGSLKRRIRKIEFGGNGPLYYLARTSDDDSFILMHIAHHENELAPYVPDPKFKVGDMARDRSSLEERLCVRSIIESPNLPEIYLCEDIDRRDGMCRLSAYYKSELIADE